MTLAIATVISLKFIHIASAYLGWWNMFPPDAWNQAEPQQSPTDFLQQEFRHRSAYNPYGYTFHRSPAESIIKKAQNSAGYDAPEGQACSKTTDCKMPGQTMDYEFHPDFMCLNGYCRRYLLPGEFGCVDDVQCNTKCKESHCAKEPHYQSIYGEYQCRCNLNFDNTTMYLYADKCWRECPSLTRPDRSGLTWKCVTGGSESYQHRLQEFHLRSKRQMTRIMC